MTPRTVQELTAGDYLQVAELRHGAWSYDHDEQYALIERIEDVPADGRILLPQFLPARSVTAVFCHGLVGPILLRPGDHHVGEVAPARRAYDEAHPWWAGRLPADTPYFVGATIREPCPRVVAAARNEARTPEYRPSRAAATFTKPTVALMAGDYLRARRITHPDADAEFQRIIYTEHLPADAAAELLTCAPAGPVVAVRLRSLGGLLVLADATAQVQVQPNIEREATERPHGGLGLTPRLHGASPVDEAQARTTDTRLRPAAPPDEADLYPINPDPHERELLINGRDDLRMVPLAALPWPAHQSKCAHFPRVKALLDDTPQSWDISQAVHAAAFAAMSPQDFATCTHHAADWATIGDIVTHVAAGQDLTTNAGKQALRHAIASDPRLDDQSRSHGLTLIDDPILWSDRNTMLTNGQHRSCALRAAGVAVCPVEGLHLADADYGPSRDAREVAREFATAEGVDVYAVAARWRSAAGRRGLGRWLMSLRGRRS